MIPKPTAGARFTATRWSVVLAAGDSASATATPALEALCRIYWPCLYAYARRLGQSPENACDLTQAFFARLIEKNWIADVDRDRGRFRTFLLTAFKRHMADANDRAHAQKRGGKIQFLPLDATDEERGLFSEPADRRTPETIYHERWARALLDTVLARLREEFRLQCRERVFDCLKGFLVGDHSGDTVVTVGNQLGMTEGAVRMTLTRMRQRYRQLLRSEIAQTVADPQAIDDELRHLFRVLTGEGR
jgi:RNA polymerase sigma factor (sigma-70 family)